MLIRIELTRDISPNCDPDYMIIITQKKKTEL